MEQSSREVTFFFYQPLSFGKALYLTGSVPELGQWDLNRALRMSYVSEHNWTLSVNIFHQNKANNKAIEFKYVVMDHWFGDISPHDRQFHLWRQTPEWLEGPNQRIQVFNKIYDKEYTSFFSQNQPASKQQGLKVKVMTYNVRLDTQSDAPLYTWEKRKENLLNLLE